MKDGRWSRAVGRSARVWVIGVVAASPAMALRADAQRADCNTPARDAVVQLPLPGRPFEALPSADGCWIFVTLGAAAPGEGGHVAVVHRSDGKLTLVRTVAVEGAPAGAVLTHDGKLLVVTANAYVDYLDVDQLTSGNGDPLIGQVDAGGPIGLVYADVSNDDRLLFLAAERADAIVVVDLDSVRATGFRTLHAEARIPTGPAPIAVTPSRDGHYLYVTSEAAPREWGWPAVCVPEARPTAPPNHAKGTVMVVDLTRLPTDAAHAVVSHVPAGCEPVRLVLSPSGDTAYVTVRGADALFAFDARKLVNDPDHALLATVPVGTAPVGVAVIDGGRKLVVTNSNRFAGSAADHQNLTVIDATRLAAGKSAVVGSIPAGGFPRELRVTADGRTLILTNFTSKTLEMVDLDRVAAGK